MTAIVKLLKNTRSRQEWAESIAATWQRAVQSAVQVVIATGQTIAEAKEGLDHGDFIAMVESDLPFDRTTAFRLMKVAANPRLSNVAHVQHLPPAWGTLYELTKLPSEKIEAGIASGAIHPAMERKDVAVLRGKPPRKKAAPKPTSPKVINFDTAIDPVDLCTMDVRAMIFATLQEIPPKRRAELFERIRGDLDDLEMKQER